MKRGECLFLLILIFHIFCFKPDLDIECPSRVCSLSHYIYIHHQLDFFANHPFLCRQLLARTGALRAVSYRVYLHFHNRLFPRSDFLIGKGDESAMSGHAKRPFLDLSVISITSVHIQEV